MTDYNRLAREIEGEVLSSSFDRGRYATDASIYQIMPRAVLVPKTWEDVEAALEFAKDGRIDMRQLGAFEPIFIKSRAGDDERNPS